MMLWYRSLGLLLRDLLLLEDTPAAMYREHGPLETPSMAQQVF
jgi:hypothetical protein